MKKGLLSLTLLVDAVLLLPNLVSAQTLTNILQNIEGLVRDVFITVVVVMWVVTGVLYLSAMGSPEKLITAKRALIASVVGTAIGILASSVYTIIENEIIRRPPA